MAREEGTSVKVRTRSGLGWKGQVSRPGQAVMWGGRERYPGKKN